jgi:hypothetical protein
MSNGGWIFWRNQRRTTKPAGRHEASAALVNTDDRSAIPERGLNPQYGAAFP